jgi:hypothetical protein
MYANHDRESGVAFTCGRRARKILGLVSIGDVVSAMITPQGDSISQFKQYIVG